MHSCIIVSIICFEIQTNDIFDYRLSWKCLRSSSVRIWVVLSFQHHCCIIILFWSWRNHWTISRSIVRSPSTVYNCILNKNYSLWNKKLYDYYYIMNKDESINFRGTVKSVQSKTFIFRHFRHWFQNICQWWTISLLIICYCTGACKVRST